MRFNTRRLAKDEVMDWIAFYSQRRLHSTLGYTSPMFLRTEMSCQSNQLGGMVSEQRETLSVGNAKHWGCVYMRVVSVLICKVLLGIAVTVGLGGASTAYAGPLEDGVEAYEKSDYANAARLFKLAADQGDAIAQFLLGVMYSEGRGVPQNYQEAVRLYRLAADQGYASAQSNLGVMYADGTGVPQNYQEAVRLYRLAADQGYAMAQYNLGVMYDNGTGVPQNYQEAVRLYRLAADQGYASAQYNLGLSYTQGTGVPQNYQEAVRLYRLAADQGYAMAQFNLGVHYANGTGVPQDYVLAHMWLNLAASSSIGEDGKKAVSSRDIVAGWMTRAQIERAQNMARMCRSSNFKNCGQ